MSVDLEKMIANADQLARAEAGSLTAMVGPAVVATNVKELCAEVERQRGVIAALVAALEAGREFVAGNDNKTPYRFNHLAITEALAKAKEVGQ